MSIQLIVRDRGRINHVTLINVQPSSYVEIHEQYYIIP